MNEQWRERVNAFAAEADSVLDQFYLRMAGLPAPWTFISTLAIVVVLLATRWI